MEGMKPLWNNSTLGRPPTSVWSPKPGDFATSSFILTINKVLKDLSCEDQLNTEAAILSRLIYRMKSKFRADKGLKSMEKVNRALLNYLKLSIEKDYEYLKENTEITGESETLPSRQMVEYVLIRTQGFAKLMCRVENVARTAARLLKNRIDLGQAWTVSVIAYSVISRIWLLSRYLLRRCCNWYNNLYPFLGKLRPVGLEWMLQEQTLPPDLKTWIAVPWIDEQIQCVTDSQESIFSLIRGDYDEEFLETQEMKQILKNNDVVVTKNKFNISSDIHQKIVCEPLLDTMLSPTSSKKDTISTENISKKSKYNRFNVILDLGEKISRESFTTHSQQPKIKRKRKDGLSKIKTKEAYPKLDKLQWRMLKNNINKTVIKPEKSSAASPKR